MPRPRPTAVAACLVTTWVACFAALQWSVVRYRLLIVAAVVLATVLLASVQARRVPLEPPPRGLLSAGLMACAVVAEAVPSFSYTSPTAHTWLLHATALTALAAAGALLASERLALGVAAAGALGTSAAAVLLDPAPRIDVWVILQQAADGMAHGQNVYEMTWRGSPGIKDAFTYLPWTAVLLAPGRLLAGDVRWALLGWAAAGVVLLHALGSRRSRPTTAAGTAALLLVLAPGTLTQSEQAWTEPLLFALLAAWAVLVQRGHPWWAVLPLALGCASKQHLALLLPVLACWPGFGLRRTVATAGLTGALVAPWFLASPSAFVHDTVTLLVGFHPIQFANTLFLAAQHELGWTPPFWLTGAAVLAVLGAACAGVRRPGVDLAELLRWLALVLLVANLVNKQAFYNQYWLVGALVALSLAAQRAPAALSPPARPRAVAAAGSPARPSPTAR